MPVCHVTLLFLSTVAGELFCVDWGAESSLSDLALLGGSSHGGFSRLLSVSLEELDHYVEVPTLIYFIFKSAVCVRATGNSSILNSGSISPPTTEPHRALGDEKAERREKRVSPTHRLSH